MQAYAIVPLGVEAVAIKELNELGATTEEPEKGGVAFRASWDVLFRVMLRARTITRVLLRIAHFRAQHLAALRYRLAQLDFSPWLGDSSAIHIQVSTHRSRMTHTGLIAETIAAAMGMKLDHQAEQTLFVRIQEETCSLSLDMVGERLDRRGYRLESAKAPLRETLAAALLRWSGWDATMPLYAPMCGSGTLAIEAALIATRRACNIEHHFPCVSWPCLPQKRWKKAIAKANALRQPELIPPMFASDLHASAIDITRRNAQRAGVDALIQCQQADFRTLRYSEAGWIICNPPFGQRIQGQGISLYRDLGQWHRGHASSCELVVLCPDVKSIQALASPVADQLVFTSGGKRLYAVRISGEKKHEDARE